MSETDKRKILYNFSPTYIPTTLSSDHFMIIFICQAATSYSEYIYDQGLDSFKMKEAG